MMKRLVLLTWLLATIINTDLISQSKEEIRNNFYDAESWILYEAFQDALPLYQQLLIGAPNNANYKYRIGQCYMNIPGEKVKAISYLEDAVKHINPAYKEGKFTETGAPYDALYYLANAYRINNQIDKALKTYEQFRKNLNTDVYDSVVVNQQIQSCRNAKELMKMPQYVKVRNLGRSINGVNNDFNPVISDKEDLLVFSRSQPFYDALLYSVKTKGVWSEPQNMNEMLKVDRDLFPTSISKDGKDLYLYSSADYDGIIYTSRFENGVWSPIVKLNDNINTKYWESHATISHDNKQLFFTSNRKGSYGGLDIYVSVRDSTGDWGPAVNLGPDINSPYNEESPFLSSDDKTLFFSSRGHFNMGGYDIFYSKLLANGKWSTPVNMGSPLNTTDDDLFFNPVNQGFEAYISKELPGGYGKQDIYKVEIFSDKHPRKFFIRGTVKAAELLNDSNDSIKVSATDLNKPDRIAVAYSNPATGEYEFQLPQGDYQLSYEGEGSGKVVKKLGLPLTNPSDSFLLPGTVLPKTDFIADLKVESNKSISVTKGDSIEIPVRAEPRSTLTVEHWIGDVLVSTEHFTMRDSLFNYKMAPGEGNNRLVFKLTDRFNNTTTTEVVVNRQNKLTEEAVTTPEYNRTISEDQIAALTGVLKNRAQDNLQNVIAETGTENKKFARIDDYMSYLKAEAARKNIPSEELDKLALKVAVMDNILTQEAVDYLARHTDGDLNKVLSGLNIYDSDIKTWTDLQRYIADKTGGKIKPDDLNNIAAGILAEKDPSIIVLKNKIASAAGASTAGDMIRQTLSVLDQGSYKSREEWLQAFNNEAVKQGMTVGQISDLLAAASSPAGTTAEAYLKNLIANSEEPLTSALKAIDLKKENIKTPAELIAYLLSNPGLYPQESVFRSIANLMASKDLTGSEMNNNGAQKDNRWILWIVIIAAVAALLFFLSRRNKNKKE